MASSQAASASSSKKQRLDSSITAYFPVLSSTMISRSESQNSELSEDITEINDTTSQNSELELDSCVEHEERPLDHHVSVNPVCNSFCCTSSDIYQPTNIGLLKKTERTMVLAAMYVQAVYCLHGIKLSMAPLMLHCFKGILSLLQTCYRIKCENSKSRSSFYNRGVL